jgi:succinate-semialdehyde dehydrogenase/glutarate-semialdehyde dehydrogenase
MVQGISIENGCIINKNPATNEVISKVPCTTFQALDEMIHRAASSQPAWAQRPAQERINLLKHGLQKLEAQSDKLIELIVQEMGKPWQEALEEVEDACHKDAFLEILLSSLQPKQYLSSRVIRSPLGVVAVLSPWNYPVGEILLLVLPALGSGNTVLVKPSEETPDTGRLVVETLASLLPDGVLQLVQGDGSVGARLVVSPTVNMIAMTGSSATGKEILKQAAPSMKRFVLELGGKDPMIVFEDADLEKAAHDAVAYSLSNAGQVCCSVERIFVAEQVYDEMQRRVAKLATDYKVGNGIDRDVKVGPLVSPLQRDKVKEHVDDAVGKGAKLLFQSDIPTDLDGSFYPVTVLADVTDGMLAYRCETFGPLVCLTSFDGSEEEAIRLANDTDFGLAGSVYTQDLDKAERVASSIQAGQIGINCYSLENMDVACPWVGYKHSGLGFHSGEEGFHHFSMPKTLVCAPRS